MFGTDHTVHWMPKQGRINEFHTDITNYFIGFGVQGGLLAVGLAIGMVVVSFLTVGKLWRHYEDEAPGGRVPRLVLRGLPVRAHRDEHVGGLLRPVADLFWLTVASISSLGLVLHREEEAGDAAVEEAPVSP